MAPEILTKRGYNGAMVDVWSCGVVLYVLNAGYLPFNDPNLMAMYKKIYKLRGVQVSEVVFLESITILVSTFGHESQEEDHY